jgi:hypothetical protein
MASFFRNLRVLLFGPTREMLQAEPPPPRQILSDEQRQAMRRAVRRS